MTRYITSYAYFLAPLPSAATSLPLGAAARRAAAEAMADDGGTVLAVGTSLAVMSGYKFILDARKQGKPTAVINGGPGRADGKVGTLWRANVADALDEILDGLDL